MIVNQGEGTLAERFDLFRVRIDVEVNHRLPSAPSSLAPVFNGDVDKIGVWNGDDRIQGGSHQCRSEIDFYHLSFRCTYYNPVADFEGTIEQDCDSAKEVGNAVFRSQCKGQS